MLPNLARTACRAAVLPVLLAVLVWAHAGTLRAEGPGPLVIDEVQTWNESGPRDTTDRSPDWIELVNVSEERLDLAGYGLSDRMAGQPKWRFPRVSLAAGGRIVVFASGAPERSTLSEYHASFKLGTEGEDLRVTRPDGAISDAVNLRPVTLPDISQGRPNDAPERWLFFERPSPGTANPTSAAGHEGIGSPVTFSHESGFYPEAFPLALGAEAGEAIHYTLDGSVPGSTEDPDISLIYAAPLGVVDRSEEPNGISMIEGTSIANQHTDGWFPPLGLVPKAFVIRARSHRTGYLPGPVSTRSYFVGIDPFTRWSLPVVSLATPPEGLFDDASGIYVLGKIFRDYQAANPGQPLTGHTPANYTQRGRDWARVSSFEFLETDGQPALRQTVGLDIQGQSSRSFRQKSFGVKPIGETAPAGALTHAFFPGLQRRGPGGERTSFEGLRLRNSGNDWDYTMFRDALCHRLVASLGIDVMTPRPVVVYLNGEFWGLYQLREQGDVETLADHYELDAERLTMAEGIGIFKEGNPDGVASYQTLRGLMARGGLEDPDVFANVSTMMDVDQFLRYQLAEIYLGNADWPHNNIRYWRTVETPPLGQPLLPGHDGRWRWQVFDADLAYGHPWSGGVADATLAAAIAPAGRPGLNAPWSTLFLRRLLENAEFRTDFINSMACYLNADFKATRAQALLQEMRAAIEDVMPDQIARWRTCQGSIAVWNSNVRVMEGFARQRPAALRQQFVREFELDGTAHMTIDVEPPNGGTVSVHRLVLDPERPGIDAPVYPWRGTFFEGLPIEVKAHARPGFRFVDWSEAGPSPSLEVTLAGDVQFTARFERDRSVPWPEIKSLEHTADGLRIDFAGAPLTRHRWQWSNDLVGWRDGEIFTTDAAGRAAHVVSLPAGEAAQYLRALVLQPPARAEDQDKRSP